MLAWNKTSLITPDHTCVGFDSPQELLFIFSYLIWCFRVKCQPFSSFASLKFKKTRRLTVYFHPDHLQQNAAGDGHVFTMAVVFVAHRCKWRNCWVWLFEVAWVVRMLIIKRRTNLLCSLLIFKQLIICNPMTHLPLKWNIFKRSLFYSCIIASAIYLVRWQLADFVYSSFIFTTKKSQEFHIKFI